jgi:hypothetical protein
VLEEEVADLIARRALEDPKVRQIVIDAHLFEALRNDPGWQRLYDKAKHEAKRLKEILAQRMWEGKNIPTPEEVAYYKGFIQGAIWVLKHPEVAEQKLESAAREAWKITQLENVNEEG